jgi:hypothetical protein
MHNPKLQWCYILFWVWLNASSPAFCEPLFDEELKPAAPPTKVCTSAEATDISQNIAKTDVHKELKTDYKRRAEGFNTLKDQMIRAAPPPGKEPSKEFREYVERMDAEADYLAKEFARAIDAIEEKSKEVYSRCTLNDTDPAHVQAAADIKKLDLAMKQFREASRQLFAASRQISTARQKLSSGNW